MQTLANQDLLNKIEQLENLLANKENYILEVEKKLANEQAISAKVMQNIINIERENREQKTILEETNTEILTQNEELQQTQEELMAQREFAEHQRLDLEKANKRMKANEQILVKAYEKIKVKEDEIRQQKAILEETNIEIFTQNEALKQVQEELTAQKEFIEKQHQELQIQNTKVKNSIQAALLIQQAVLPYPEKMQALLNKYFIIYKPKDIVSGDFWWLHEINNKVFLAAIDCTGHGVAGAFMTLIANTLLDKIVKLVNIHAPAQILKALHEEVQNILRQNETGNSYGMDMSLLVLEKQINNIYTLTFAGAKRPIYIIQHGELTEFKGTRKGIGGRGLKEVAFEEQIIEIETGTWIYTGTDGLTDQNNTERNRLGDNALKALLAANYQLEAELQEQAIIKMLQNHIQNEEQRDDILWIGFQI